VVTLVVLVPKDPSQTLSQPSMSASSEHVPPGNIDVNRDQSPDHLRPVSVSKFIFHLPAACVLKFYGLQGAALKRRAADAAVRSCDDRKRPYVSSASQSAVDEAALLVNVFPTSVDILLN